MYEHVCKCVTMQNVIWVGASATRAAMRDIVARVGAARWYIYALALALPVVVPVVELLLLYEACELSVRHAGILVMKWTRLVGRLGLCVVSLMCAANLRWRSESLWSGEAIGLASAQRLRGFGSAILVGGHKAHRILFAIPTRR